MIEFWKDYVNRLEKVVNKANRDYKLVHPVIKL